MKKFFTILSLITALFAFTLTQNVALAKSVCYKNLSTDSLSDGANGQKIKNYGVITVTFLDQDLEKVFPSDYVNTLFKTLQTSPQSVKNYFSESSSGKYLTDFTLLNQTPIVIDEEQNRYMPKYSFVNDEYLSVNEFGYDNRYFDENDLPCSSENLGAKRHIDRLLREQSLIKKIIGKINDVDVNLDGDNNGVIDGLIFIFGTESDAEWNEVLWEHRSNLPAFNEEKLKSDYYVPEELSALDFLPAYINGKAADNYTVFRSLKVSKTLLKDQNQDIIFSCGIFCHELMHDTGVADYYPYSGDAQPVGELDIMGEIGILPSMPLTYTRERLGWLNDGAIIPAEKSGNYALYPVTSDKTVKAIKLVLNDYRDKGEYFMIEARTNSGSLSDVGLSSSGIIVYRVNERCGYIGADGNPSTLNLGNMYGDNEVFVYRLGDDKLYSNKEKSSYAILNGSGKIKLDGSGKYVDASTVGNPDKSAYKTVIGQNDLVLTSLYYTDETNSGVVISNITETKDGGFSFNLNFDDSDAVSEKFASVDKYYDDKTSVVNWFGEKRNETVTVYAVSGEGITKYKNGSYVLNKKVTKDDFESGSVLGNPVIYKSQNTASYCRAFLPKLDTMTAVFVAFSDGNVIYAGTVNPRNPTFKEYLFGTPKWLSLIIGIIALTAVLIVVAVYLIIKRARKDAEVSQIDDNAEYTAIYGENYWMREEDTEADIETDTEQADFDDSNTEVDTEADFDDSNTEADTEADVEDGTESSDDIMESNAEVKDVKTE